MCIRCDGSGHIRALNLTTGDYDYRECPRCNDPTTMQAVIVIAALFLASLLKLYAG